MCVAEIVPQRLQTPYKCSNFVLIKEASHKFDGIVQILQRDTQPVPLSCLSTLRTSCCACKPCDDVVRSGPGQHRRYELEEQPHARICVDRASRERQTITKIATSIRCIFRKRWPA